MEAMALLIVLGIQDIQKKKLSGKILYGALFLAFAIAAGKGHLFPSGIAGMLLGAVLLALSYLTKNQFGSGDAMVLMITGALLGIRKNVELFFLALVLASVYAGYLLLVRRCRKNDAIAFVPFLAAAQAILLLAGLFE